MNPEPEWLRGLNRSRGEHDETNINQGKTMRYHVIPGTPVVAVQLAFDNMQLLHYTKWGGAQVANHGDWLIADPAGGAYTCDQDVFAATYRETEVRGQYQKFGTIEAERATEDGVITTLEGSSEYAAGDYIVTNPTGERYPVKAAVFGKKYRAAA